MARSLRTLGDLSNEELALIIARSLALKPALRARADIGTLRNRVVGLLFEKPSTRTRNSFEAATARLGGTAIYMASSELQLKRGEPLADTARVLGSYMDALVWRGFDQATVDELAEHAGVPVVNGLSDLVHPTQAICDLATVVEAKGSLAGQSLTYVGDGNNVAHSLLLAGAKTGMNVSVACPPGYEPDAEWLAGAQDVAAGTGARLGVLHDPEAAAAGADILYTDVWVSMGDDGESEQRERAFADFQLDSALLAAAKPDAVVMHCLPAHRGHEITDEVIEGPQSVVWTQAENKMHGAAAILEFLLGVG